MTNKQKRARQAAKERRALAAWQLGISLEEYDRRQAVERKNETEFEANYLEKLFDMDENSDDNLLEIYL